MLVMQVRMLLYAQKSLVHIFEVSRYVKIDFFTNDNSILFPFFEVIIRFITQYLLCKFITKAFSLNKTRAFLPEETKYYDYIYFIQLFSRRTTVDN